MKKIGMVFSLVFLAIISYCQTPNSFNYQSVIRDISGNPKVNQSVTLELSIIADSPTNSPVYSESHITSTNNFGLVNLQIGKGVTQNDFSTIDWSTGVYYLEIAVDGVVLGTTQFISVPYAKYAEKTGSSFSGDFNDLTNKPSLYFSNDTLHHTSIDYVVLPYSSDLTVNLEGGNLSCSGSGSGFINATVSGGKSPYSYSWSNDATTPYISELSSGTYSVVVIDNAGNSTSNSIVITEPNELLITSSKNDPTCFNSNNGQITLVVSGGTKPYTFEWSNGSYSQNQSTLSDGEYSVRVIDANNCFGYDTLLLIEPNEITVTETISNISCNGESTGAISLSVSGGSAPYTYSWSNSAITKDISDVTVGIYSVTVYDNSSCSNNFTFDVTENSEITLDEQSTNNSCPNQNTGSIEITPAGGVSPYTYLWSTGSTDQNLTSVSSDSYNVDVSDNLGCVKNFSFNISTYPDISATATVIDEVNSGIDGQISLDVTGSASPFTFSWSNGSSTSSISNIAANSYSVTITDNNSCSASDSYTINNISSVTDYDGNVYSVVKIGNQIWMSENLKSYHFDNGWEITDIHYPNNDVGNVSVYGILYPSAILSYSDVCPSGWSVPSKYDWQELSDTLRGSTFAGGSMKEVGISHWQSPNTGATNESGFTGLPAGIYNNYFGHRGYFHSIETSTGNIFYLMYSSSAFFTMSGTGYYSIRCIKE